MCWCMLLSQGVSGSSSRNQVSLTLMPPVTMQNCLPVPMDVQVRLHDVVTKRALDLESRTIAAGSNLVLPYAHHHKAPGAADTAPMEVRTLPSSFVCTRVAW